MVETASNIAKYIINGGTPITNLKLQKLLYYAQAWHLAIHEKALFSERIEAWVHGPVVPPVFQEYRDYKWAPLPIKNRTPVTLTREVCRHITEVMEAYGNFDASQLERLTHNEDPWKEARKGIPNDMPSNSEITHASMVKYYRARLNG